jgi:hypothetical protein
MVTLFDHVSDAALPQTLFDAVSRTYEEYVDISELRFDEDGGLGGALNEACIQVPLASPAVRTITRLGGSTEAA